MSRKLPRQAPVPQRDGMFATEAGMTSTNNMPVALPLDRNPLGRGAAPAGPRRTVQDGRDGPLQGHVTPPRDPDLVSGGRRRQLPPAPPQPQGRGLLACHPRGHRGITLQESGIIHKGWHHPTGGWQHPKRGWYRPATGRQHPVRVEPVWGWSKSLWGWLKPLFGASSSPLGLARAHWAGSSPLGLAQASVG